MYKFIVCVIIALAPALASAQGLDDCSGPQYAVVDATVAADTTLVTAVTGKKIRVLSFHCSAVADTYLAFEDGTGGTRLTGRQRLWSEDGLVTDEFNMNCAPYGCFETSAGALLNLENTASAETSCFLTYALCN